MRAEPVASTKFSYYDIQGDTSRELRASMNRQKPKGVTMDALTVWNVTWSYTWRREENGAGIQNPRVSVVINTTLPRWTPPKNADKRLLERWQNYTRALLHHESGHAAIAIQAARDIEKKLASLPRQPSEEALKQAVETTGEQVLNEARAREKSFDLQTQHGMKQGARFP